jgi:cobalt-zinc-cadmium efflux system outer membrane protein
MLSIASRFRTNLTGLLLLTIVVCQTLSYGQEQARPTEGVVPINSAHRGAAPDETHGGDKGGPRIPASLFADPVQGVSVDEVISRALVSNEELSAVRLEIERARARVRQAGLRPNPTLDFEQASGRFSGSPGERETSLSLSLPLELNGQRGKRIALAKAELEAAEAFAADAERRLVAEVRIAYADALAGVRELEITDGLHGIDVQTARIIEVRVGEGESAPIELNLLQNEIDRLRSRRAVVEGRLQASLLRLKSLGGIPADEPLRLKEDLTATTLQRPQISLEAAVDIALRSRPDLRLAKLNESAAQAGLALARAQAGPDVSAFARVTANSSVFDNTPVGALRDKDRLIAFGFSVTVPLFNRNQGAKADAETGIAQAIRRREFVERLVRAEVASAYARYSATQAAVDIFEQGVLVRSAQNIRSIRGAYELGAFRITELLSEQRRLLDSQREYTEALTERYKAMAEFLSAVGVDSNAK